MWTISNAQLLNISGSMRIEFERRMCYLIHDKLTCNLSEDEVKKIVNLQTDKIIKYAIISEESALSFILLSLDNSALCAECLEDDLDKLLSSDIDDSEKIDIISNYFNSKQNE